MTDESDVNPLGLITGGSLVTMTDMQCTNVWQNVATGPQVTLGFTGKYIATINEDDELA